MQLNKKTFYLITFLFLLMPLSVNYRMLIFGKHTTGKVVKHINRFQMELPISNPNARYSVIRFTADNRFIEFATPQDLKYPIGKEINIFYSKKNPEKFLMFNLAGLLLNNRMIVPLVLFIMWLAFYTSLKRPSQNTGLSDKKLIKYKKMFEKKA